ncbi:hypothetical protein OUZ56_002805 [Daphnia magna]|uniref:Uncharacterized protein n=1 Tax=Daphnia magna TaxID=35525 RepID=A0ABR0A6U1_9CRUS|nr:hypothetical protein OUZ56_002805 [Daphnia magna]
MENRGAVQDTQLEILQLNLNNTTKFIHIMEFHRPCRCTTSDTLQSHSCNPITMMRETEFIANFDHDFNIWKDCSGLSSFLIVESPPTTPQKTTVIPRSTAKPSTSTWQQGNRVQFINNNSYSTGRQSTVHNSGLPLLPCWPQQLTTIILLVVVNKLLL